jgi:hypothetical protein
VQLLQDLIADLFPLCRAIHGVEFHWDIPFERMCLFFTTKQEIHAQSLLLLTDTKSRDAKLIARSMAEGMILLVWTNHDSHIRADRWMKWAYVQDWRRFSKDAHSRPGHCHEALRKAAISLAEHGDIFLTNDTRRRLADGEPLKHEPLSHTWYGHSLHEVFAEVEASLMYEYPYSDFSEYHHWSVGGIISAVGFEKDQYGYHVDASELEIAETLAVGFQSLFHVLEIANRVFDLGIESELHRVRARHPAIADDR